ncbi:outer membrane protein assembly factor BamE [Paraburkholderia sp. BR14263]|uniref:outer membrane protein assembly factor BamE domain-containing protein n=1 Tax=unclassified Paraburkholderia TaxID=2615204 RepID=UPI0034CD21F8
MLLVASAVSVLAAGCDEQKVTDAVNAIKPDAMAFGNLQPGVSTVDDVRQQAGKPEIVWQNDDGSERLEYPRGPNGLNTYMLDFGPDGRLISITQALTADNIAKVMPGMTQDDVRRLLGKPATVAQYALSHETVWSWHWAEGGVSGDAMFNAHFSPDGVVSRTSRSEAPGREKP